MGKSVARLSVMMLRVFMGMAGCCAWMVSGQAAAAPPSVTMKSRRRTWIVV
jgi:uncharacterized protein YchJ